MMMITAAGGQTSHSTRAAAHCLPACLDDGSIRDSLFWNLYRGTLVFESLQQAQDYRQDRIARKDFNVPTIVTLTGQRLTSTGGAGGR